LLISLPPELVADVLVRTPVPGVVVLIQRELRPRSDIKMAYCSPTWRASQKEFSEIACVRDTIVPICNRQCNDQKPADQVRFREGKSVWSTGDEMKIDSVLVPALLCATVFLSSAAASAGRGGDEGAQLWGARGIALRMTEQGAKIEFDCAHASILQPIEPNASGEFSVPGTYTPEAGGPVQKNNPGRDLPATFHGVIRRDSIHLEMTVSGEGQQPRSFTLTRGNPGRLVKCR